MNQPINNSYCPKCEGNYVEAVFATEPGYIIAEMCLCEGQYLRRVSRGLWSTFNGAEEALEAGEFERMGGGQDD